jgi:hypothetical protein
MPIANNVIVDRVPGDSILASMFNTVKNGLAPEVHAARHAVGGADALANLTAPAAPTFGMTGNVGGTLTIPTTQFLLATPFEVTFGFQLQLSGITATSQVNINPTPPSGYSIQSAIWGWYDNLGNSRDCVASHTGSAICYPAVTTTYFIVCQITLRKN